MPPAMKKAISSYRWACRSGAQLDAADQRHPGHLFAVQGLGESQPAATNDTPQGGQSTGVSKSVLFRVLTPVRTEIKHTAGRRRCFNHTNKESILMAIPAYLWLKDDGGADIKVPWTFRGAKVASKWWRWITIVHPDRQQHRQTDRYPYSQALTFTKEIDASSPYLYKAVTTARL